MNLEETYIVVITSGEMLQSSPVWTARLMVGGMN